MNDASQELEWLLKINIQELPRLRTAAKEPILLDGANVSSVKIDELRGRIWFEIFKNSAVEILLGTPLMDRYIPEIFSSEIKDPPRYSPPLRIASHTNSATVPFQLNELDWTEVPIPSIQLARQTVIKPRSKMWVLVNW